MPPLNPAPGSRGRRLKTFTTPRVEDYVFYENRDARLPEHEEPPAYGTPHPEKDLFPDFFLVFISPSEDETPDTQRWFYARTRKKQEEYNYEFVRDETLTRTYVFLRSQFEEWEDTNGESGLDIPDRGDPDPVFIGWTFGIHSVSRIDDPVLDSMFVMLEFSYANTGDIALERDAAPSQRIVEAGTLAGERTVDTAKAAVASATPISTGVVLRRQSSLTDEGLYSNEEEQLDVRAGDNRVVDDFTAIPGVKREVSRGLSLTEPSGATGAASFRKELQTVDVDGADAFWEYEETLNTANPVTGSGISRLLGAGIYTESRTMVDDGVAADTGFLIDDSEVQPLGDGSAVKSTKTLTDFPTLIEYRYDEDVDELIKITKTVVPSATVTGSVAAQDVTEVVPYDRWRDITVRSEYVADPTLKTWTLPFTRSWQYPPVLVGVNLVYTNAYASASNGYSYDEALAPEFDVEEGFEANVEGRIIRTITSIPSVIGDTPVLYQPASYSLAYTAAWWFTTPGGGAFARANARVWQTPLALVQNAITITEPTWNPGLGVTVDGDMTGSIPATPAPPTGWTTIRATTRKLKLGLFEVLTEQVYLQSPFTI